MIEPSICDYEVVKDFILQSFSQKRISLLVGSGITCGDNAYKGKVPMGEQMPCELKEIIKNSSVLSDEDKIQIEKENSLQKLSVYFENEKIVSSSIRKLYYRDHFTNVKMDATRKKIFDIDWDYVYSLNIDDGIEKNTIFDFPISCNKPVEDEIFGYKKCVIKLHGDITEYLKYKNECIIFSSNEYARSLIENESLLTRLKVDCTTKTLLIVGCSLVNEYDLMSLKNLPINEINPNHENRKIICVTKKPSPLEMSNYQLYGITDIIVFNNFDDIYNTIYETWKESKSIRPDILDDIKNFSMTKLTKTENNKEFFYQGKSLLDMKNKTITYPAYFINRDMLRDISLDRKIHIIRGNSFSGKSYLMASIYQKFSPREMYYLDSKNTINIDAFDLLLKKRSSIFLFDAGSINELQLKTIIEKAEELYNNNNTIFIVLNNDDSEIYSFIRYRMKTLIKPNEDYIVEHIIENKLSENETSEINKSLPIVRIPSFLIKNTILDNLIRAEESMDEQGRFRNFDLEIKTVKQIALLIMFAIKENVSIHEIIAFGLDIELYDYLQKYPKFFEKVSVPLYEKNIVDSSDVKFIINSKYWLCRELGKFIYCTTENNRMVLEAYEYIIKKIITKDNSKARIRRMYRNYIYFDIVNNIFITEKKGHIWLIAQIYMQLFQFLGDDYQFLHQYAKCFLKASLAAKEQSRKIERIKDAKEKINLAISQIEAEMETKDNERLQTSYSHLQYTKASIECTHFHIISPSNIRRLEDVIQCVYIALSNPINLDDYKNNTVNSREIKNFISFLRHKQFSKRPFELSDKANITLQEIFTLAYGVGKKYSY